MTVCEKGLVILLAGGAVFALLSIPLILRKVPRNPVYGYRTRRTLADERLWYAANAYFGRRFLIASAVSAAVGTAAAGWGGIPPAVCLKGTVVLLAAPAVVAGLLTARFVRSLGLPPRPPESRRPRP